MSNPHWQAYFARKFSLQRFEIVMCVFRSELWKNSFGVQIEHLLVKPGEGKNHEIYMDSREWARAQKAVFDVVYRTADSWNYYKSMIKRVQFDWVRAAENVGRQVNPTLSNEELAELYDIFIHHQEHFNAPIWIPFSTEPLLADAAQAALVCVLERANNMSEYQYWFDVIFSPDEQNAISTFQQEICSLALAIKKNDLGDEAREKESERLARMFGFIPCYDVIDPPWNPVDMKKELSVILEKSEEEIGKEYRERTFRCEKIRDAFQRFFTIFFLEDRERELLAMVHDLVFIKDERDDYRRRGSFFGRPLFLEISRRLGVESTDASYLTIDETKQFLREGVGPSTEDIKERTAGYFLMIKDGGPLVVAGGEKMNAYIQQELGSAVENQAEEVQGISASRGIVRGRVVIVRTRHDLRRVENGDIMIAVTTNPDYVPAMKRCRAIVTNEGGITSHAAIVSRELKIPCIVGTKNATRVFSEGTMVEVDGELGSVRKL